MTTKASWRGKPGLSQSCEEFELTNTDQTFDERVFDDCRTKSDLVVESCMIPAEFFSKTSRNESRDLNFLLSVR